MSYESDYSRIKDIIARYRGRGSSSREELTAQRRHRSEKVEHADAAKNVKLRLLRGKTHGARIATEHGIWYICLHTVLP